MHIRQFAGDDENVIINADVRFEGKGPLPRQLLEEKGFGRLSVPAPGGTVEVARSTHYRIENGRFREIRCVIKEP